MKINVTIQDDTQNLGYVGLVRYGETGMFVQQFVPFTDTIPFWRKLNKC